MFSYFITKPKADENITPNAELTFSLYRKNATLRLVFNVKDPAFVVLIIARIKLSFVMFQKVGKSNKNLLNYIKAVSGFVLGRFYCRWVLW